MDRSHCNFYKSLIDNNKVTNKPPLKIGYVVSLFPCWSETFILNELIELDKKGIDITIFSIRKDLEDFIQEKSKKFIDRTKYLNNLEILKSIIFWTINRPFVILRLLVMVLCKKYKSLEILQKNLWGISVGCYFATLSERFGLTLIHAHFATYPAFVALVISKLTGIPFTFTAHAHDIFLDKTLLKEKAKEAKNIVAISQYNKRYLLDYCGNVTERKIKVVHCGIDLSCFPFASRKEKDTENIILSIGRLTEMKGFDYLIKACYELKNKIQFKCHIIGDGPLRNYLSRLINDLGLSDCVFLDGVKENRLISKFLKSSVLFVLPSEWSERDGQDGIPVVLMEAMASGIPVISSNISGIPELVIDKETGLLVAPKDAKELANKILELLKNNILREQLAKKGRLKIEQEFDIEKNTNLLIDLFKDSSVN